MHLFALIVIFSGVLASARVIKSDFSNKACTRLIEPSLASTFNWTSASALSLAQCLQYHTPDPDTCVFYTSAARDDAIRYAASTNRTTIYDVYSPADFDITKYPASVWHSKGHLRDLFRITSKAYAISCSGRASLVLPKPDSTVCEDSIWVTDEYHAIRNGLSRINEPVSKVSWARDPLSGVWRWIAGLWEHAGLGLKKRGALEQIVVSVTEVQSEVERKVRELNKKWKWSEGWEDGWSAKESCVM